MIPRRLHGGRGRVRTGALGGALALIALLGLAPVAGAQDAGDTDPTTTVAAVSAPVVEGIDARGDTWTATGISPGGTPSILFDGEKLDTEPSDATTDLVLVIDNDRGLPNGALQLSGDAAATLLPGAGPIRRVAVVSTARQGARQVQGLTSDPGAVDAAIDGILADGDAATWDAIARAADLLGSSDASAKRVVAYLSAPDKLSLTTPGAAEASLRLADARLDVVALPSGVNTAALSEMVAVAGGSLQQVGSDEAYAATTEGLLGGLQEQFDLRFPAPPGSEEYVRLEFSSDGASSEVRAERGAVAVGPLELSTTGSSTGLLDRIVSNPLVHWFAILLIAAAVVGFVWSLLHMVLPDADSLSSRLQVYEEAPEEALEGEPHDPVGVATVPLLQRAVAFTGEVAEKRGFLDSIEVSLERASLPLRAAEAVFFLVSLAFLLGVATFVVSGSAFMALIVAVFAILIPKGVLDMRVRRRQKAFVAQLPDMLALLAGTLKAGYSIAQGFEAVSREVDDPMGKELRRVVTEHRLGRTLEDALDATANRMGSDDFAWTVMAIKIQREVGGNLAELLMTVANTMTQRERLRRDVNSLTAEGRISAFILGLLPPALGVVMYVMNRDYIMDLFTPGLGYVMVGAALIAMVIGFAWMKKIITIEV